MKNFAIKSALVVILALMTIPTMAQKIVYDNLDSETGLRDVTTESIKVSALFENIRLNVSLESTIENNDTTIFLCMGLTSVKPMSANKGSGMLIKLMNDKVMELSSICEVDDQVGEMEDWGSSELLVYVITPSYAISVEQLEEIMQVGVKKIRIESSPNYYEKDFSKDKVGAAVKKLYPILRKTIDTPKSFHADF